MGAFAQKLTAGGEGVYLIRGGQDSHGQDTWFFVDVPSPKRAAFLKAVRSGRLDVAQYGTVLESGFGKGPHPAIISRMQAEHGYQGE
jgi:hypothetical protein